MLEPACADLSNFASTSLREQIGRLAIATVGGPTVVTSGGVADVVKALEASGEPVGQTMRRHTVVDFGRPDREAGGLAPCDGAGKLVRHLRPRLDNAAKVHLGELVQRDRRQCDNRGSARLISQN